MKKRVLFLITLMFVLFSVSSLFADRNISGSSVKLESVWLTNNPNYVAGTTDTILFVLDNASPDSAGITTVTIDFPPGVTVLSQGSGGGGIYDAKDFTAIANYPPEFLDYGLETGNGATITFASGDSTNNVTNQSLGTDATCTSPGIVVSVDPGFVGPIVLHWSIIATEGTTNNVNAVYSTDPGYNPMVWGPPYGIATFTIESLPSGTPNNPPLETWIIGDTLCLEVTTVGYADTVDVDLSDFGGPSAFQLAQDDSITWSGCYVIPPGYADSSYDIVARAHFPTPGEDYETISGLYVDNEAPLPTTYGYFEVLDYDTPPDSNEIADWNFGDNNDRIRYWRGEEATGDGIVWTVPKENVLAVDIVVTEPGLSSHRAVFNGHSPLLLPDGGINWDMWDPEIIVSDDAGNDVTINVAPDSLVLVDNMMPINPDTTYFEVGQGPARLVIDPYAGIGDTITAFVDFTTMAPIESGVFDFTPLNPDTPTNDAAYLIPGIIDGNIMYAQYVVQSGDVDQLPPTFPMGLIFEATLVDSAGNYSDPPIEIGGSTGDTLFVDGTIPVALTDIHNVGYLRFSPETDSSLADYTTLTNMPDSLVLRIVFDDWGVFGGPDEFVVRIEQENLFGSREANPSALKTYKLGDPDVWVEEINRAAVSVLFSWNGIIPDSTDFGTPGEMAPEGTYGFTLVSMLDGADNEGVLGHDPETADPANGIFLINAEHGVIDNTPPEYENELAVFGSDDTEVTVIERWINDTNYNDSLDTGDFLLEVDSVYFQFDVTRQWEENDNPLRDETVTYWIELEGPDSTKYRYFLGDEDNAGLTTTQYFGNDLSTFIEYGTVDNVVFGTFNEINGSVGAGKDIRWWPTLEGGIGNLMFPEGLYTITAKVRDNAGNIRDGQTVVRAQVLLVDMLYSAPVPDSLVIISEHTCAPDTTGLAAYDLDGNHNFYVDASFDTLREDYYYNSPDVFEVYLRLADLTYLDSVVVENLYPIVTHGSSRADIINGQLPNKVFKPEDFDPTNFDLTFSYNVAGIDETAAWDSLYTVGYLNTAYPGLAFQVRVYDSYYGGEINFGAALADSFNLIRPEEPVWPGGDSYDLEVVLSDDRFSPGWYTHTYDAVDNPARDGEQDQVMIDLTYTFTEPTTRDFTWFLAIDTEPITSMTRVAFDQQLLPDLDRLAFPVTSFSPTTIDFYGLANDIMDEPIIGQTDIGKLYVTAFALAEGYEDCGYDLPPALEMTSVLDTLWVDNTDPGIIPVDSDSLYDWQGDPNYAGHLFIEDMVVSHDKDNMIFRFRTDEPLPDSTLWTAVIVDENGNPLVIDSNTIGVTVNDVVGYSNNFTSNDKITEFEFEGYKEFEMDVTITDIPVGGQYLDCVLVIMAPADDAGNPDYLADPHYPFDTLPPYFAGSDAYRWDTSEAFVRFMILEEIPFIGEMVYTHENTIGIMDSLGGLTGHGYINADSTFDFMVTINDLLWAPPTLEDDVYTRSIRSFVDVDFSEFGAEAYENDLAYATIEQDSLDENIWYIFWDDVPTVGIDDVIRYADGTVIQIPVHLELVFEDVDAGHTFYQDMAMPVIVDIVQPAISMMDPIFIEETTRDPEMNEGSKYRVNVIRTDGVSNIFGVDPLLFTDALLSTVLKDTLVCDDPTVIIEKFDTVGDTVKWDVTIQEEDPVRVKTFTATAWDNVNNMNTVEKIWDIGNIPTVAIDDFFNVTHPLAPYFITNGDDADLYVTIIDTERVELVNIWLNTDFVYPVVAREQFLADSVLTFTMGEFLALPDQPEQPESRAVIFGEVNKVISLGSLNALGTLPECDDVDAWVQITHEYDHNLDDQTVNTVDPIAGLPGVTGLTIDNTAPAIENITYTLTPTGSTYYNGSYYDGATIQITADIFDQPDTPGCAAGIDDTEVWLLTQGVNGSASPIGYTRIEGDTYIWELTWPNEIGGVSPWVDGIDEDPLASIDGIIHIEADDNLGHTGTNFEQIDTAPVVEDVTFYVNDMESNVIFPEDLPENSTVGDVYVDVEVTSTVNHLMFIEAVPDTFYSVHLEYTGNIDGVFESGIPELLTPDRDDSTYTFRFYPTFSGLDSLETTGFSIADFKAYAVSMYNYRSVDFLKQMIVVDYPREDLYGIIEQRDQAVYAGVDPSGWFAPEHNIQGTITFFSPVELTNEEVIGNFDYVGDFVEPWIYPNAIVTDTVTPVSIFIGPEGSEVEFIIDIYTQIATWDEVITDAQSIWNEILPTDINDSPNNLLSEMGVTYPTPTSAGNIVDGYHIPIPVVAWQLGYELPWIKFIQVDMNNPGYSTADGQYFYFEEIDRTAPIDFDLQLSKIVDTERVPSLDPITTGSTSWDPVNRIYTVEVPYDEIPFTQNIVLTTYGSDFTPQAEYPSVGGVGVLRVDQPTTTGLMDINPYGDDEFGFLVGNTYSTQLGDSVFYANWLLSPLTGFNHGDSIIIQLGQVWDQVGHNEGYAPEFTIVFSAQYQDVNTDELLIYDYKTGDPTNAETAPYVQAGGEYGLQIPVLPLSRDTGINYVEAYVGMIENYVTSIEEADSLYDQWRTLDDINDSLFYLTNSGFVVHPDYVDGDQLYTKIRIHYSNGSIQETGWITARTENYAIVDGVDPEIIEYGIEIWSETLEGPDVGGEEGYVMPGDIDGHLRVTFSDNLGILDYDLGAVPMVEVSGLNMFIDGRMIDGTFTALPDPLVLPADSFTSEGGNWVAEIDSLQINCDNNDTVQEVLSVNLWDPVGNAFDGNPATKFVEVTEDGPIVPIIRGIAIEAGDFPNPVFSADASCPYTEDIMVTTDPLGAIDFNSAAVGPNAEITFRVYVRAAYEAFIEGLWLDLSDLGGPAEAYIPHADIVEYDAAPDDDNLWVGTYVMQSPVNAVRGDVATITAYTIRQPFDAFDVFSDNFSVELNLDEDNVGITDTHVSSNYPTVDWVINPDATIEVWATFTDLLGEFADSTTWEWLEASSGSRVPVEINEWFSVQNNGVDAFFGTMAPYYPNTVTLEDSMDTAVCYWTFEQIDLAPEMYDSLLSLYEGTEDQFVNILFNARNIYNETFTWDSADIRVDDLAPRFLEETYTYGSNHMANRTIVPFENNGSAWDDAMMHLVYEDVTGVDGIWTDWYEFGGLDFYINPDGSRSTEEFTFPFGTDIYNVANIPDNPYDTDNDLSWNDFVALTLTDNVFNTSDTSFVNTTFVFEEENDYESFDVTMYPNDNFVDQGGYWYTVNPYMEFYVEHNVMGYDEIDNDVELPFDAMHEGIEHDGMDFDPLYIEVNHHVYNNWYPFPYDTHMVNDTVVISMEGQYELLTDGVYDMEVHTQNIFGHDIMGSLRFSVDNMAPIVRNFSFDNDTNFDMNDVVIVTSDWSEISVRFQDQIITGSGDLPYGPIPGVGVFRDSLFLDTRLDLYAGEEAVGTPIASDTLYWSGGRLVAGFWDDARWAGDNLSAGYYTISFHVTDLLGNVADYTKTFWYSHEDPNVELHVFDHNFEEINPNEILNLSDEIAYLGATVWDEYGNVTDVDFELWFDVDNDEELTGEDVQYSFYDTAPDPASRPLDHITGTPDMEVPFEATWHIMDWDYLYNIDDQYAPANVDGYGSVDEHVRAYNYRDDDEIFNTDTRYWFIVTKVVNSGGQVIQDTTRWYVKDDVGPAPMLTGITNSMYADTDTYNLVYDFDYTNYFHNTSNLRAICQYDSNDDGIVNTNWPDAWKVDFIIEGPGYNVPFVIEDTYMQPALPLQPGYFVAFWDWSQLALDAPGDYTITAMGYDRVGNTEMSLNSFTVNISTESTAYADLSMWNFDLPSWDDDVLIPDGEDYGPIDPIENIINLRLEAIIYDVDQILEAGFFYNIRDNVTGEYVETHLPLLNDTDIQPDFPEDLSQILPYQMEINTLDDTATLEVVVQEGIYMGPEFDMHDYTYEFEIWLTNFAGVSYLLVGDQSRDRNGEDPVESIRVDYVAPDAFMMEVSEIHFGDSFDDITVKVPREGNTPDEWDYDGYDLGGEHSLIFKWSYDGEDWNEFTGEDNVTENLVVPTREYWYENWDTRVINELDVYNYEGWVYVTAEVQDVRGNWQDAVPTMVYVDNQAPSVPITEVAYRSLPGVDNEDPSLYLDWHDLGYLLGEEDNTITCIYDPDDTEDALLRVRVHQSEIENLSYYNIPPGADSDLAMPIRLLWGPGDEVGPYMDQPFVLGYDHEIDPDGWYHFEILLGDDWPNFDPDQVQYFAFAADDVFGNVEGDQPVFNNYIDSDEFADMWDLRVIVIDDSPVMTQVIQPPHPFMSEIVNIGAVVTGNEASKPVDYFTFQYSPDGHNWTDIATEEYETDRGDGVEDFTFHIYRHELPWFNDMPYVPGIHIYLNGEEVADMNNIYVDDPFGDFDPNDGPMGGWTKTVELPVDLEGYNFEFFIDVNDDGVAGPGDPTIPDHEYNGIQITENMVPFDTRELDARLADGLYYFRAVPHTPDADSRGAMMTEYQIDNTPPTLLLDIVGNDDEMPTYSYDHDELDLVTDVNDLLVYDNDFLMVEYQYSVEAPGTEFRQWFFLDATNMLPGDFGYTFDLDEDMDHPMYDDIDNDNDGLVDEADEANAYVYIRTWSHDPAGNFSYSNEEMILVDGSEPYLHITSIGGQLQSGPEWVVNIPADGMIELVAHDITPEYLDDAVLADFYYKSTHDSEYILIEEGVDVVDGSAVCMWDINIPEDPEEREPGIALEEGYYTLMVIGWDRVMNETDQMNPLFVETTFILNDATGPEAYISSIGTSTEIEDTNFFGNEADFDGTVTVMITNPEDVATVTLEYSIDNVVYHNINTIAYDGGTRESYVTFDWELPYEEDMTYYLRAYVEDYEANDNDPLVMFYYDNTAPMLAVDPGITTVIDIEIWDGIVVPVLDYRADSVRTMVEYIADEFHGLIDVASVDINLIPGDFSRTFDGYDLGANTYDMIGTLGDEFVFDMNDQNAVSDEYEVEVILTDFAGNQETYYFYYIVIDNTPPSVECALQHITDENGYQYEWYDVADGEVIQFVLPMGEMNWYDDVVNDTLDWFLGVETVLMTLACNVDDRRNS